MFATRQCICLRHHKFDCRSLMVKHHFLEKNAQKSLHLKHKVDNLETCSACGMRRSISPKRLAHQLNQS